MKTLLLLRHAKSSWKHPELADHDRPLNKRGQRAAPRMGALLHDEDLTPDLIITSTAVRALRTAELVAEACGYEGELKRTRKLYEGGPETYFKILRETDEAARCVLMVGHNPTLEELVEQLTGEAEALPTSALVHIELPLKRWRDLRDDSEGKLKQIWRPKEIMKDEEG